MGTRENLQRVLMVFECGNPLVGPSIGLELSRREGYARGENFPKDHFMTLLIAGLALFIVTHLLRPLAPGLRNAGIAALGKPAWMALHGIVSLASLVLIVYGFADARAKGGALLYSPPTFMAHIALTLMLIASVCLVAGFLPAGHIRAKLKFPVLVAIKIWALAHLLANGESYSVLLFATILAWAVILRITLKKRIAAGETMLPVFVSAKYDLISLVVGVALYLAIVFKLHEWLIGVAPMA